MLNITAGQGVPAISQQISEIATYLEWVINRHGDAAPDKAALFEDLYLVMRALRYLEILVKAQESVKARPQGKPNPLAR